MTVQELIQKLQTFDPNLDVYIEDNEWGIQDLIVKQQEVFKNKLDSLQSEQYRPFVPANGDHHLMPAILITMEI